MPQSEKIKRQLEELKAMGVDEDTAAPPLWCLLWHFGFDVPPPLLSPWYRNALVAGVVFGSVYWLLSRISFDLHPALFGSGVGIIFALYFHWRGRKFDVKRCKLTHSIGPDTN